MTHKFSGFAILCLVATLCSPSAATQSNEQDVHVKFDEMVSNRTEGRFDEAIVILEVIIGENLENDDVLRRAYIELVFTHLVKGDETAAEQIARTALERFPDLEPDPVYVPAKVSAVLDELRKQIYGGFEITTIPDSCRVILDGRFLGRSPLTVDYVNAGEHVLELNKDGYFDLSNPISVAPGITSDIHYALIPKDRKVSEWQKIYFGPGLSTPLGDAKTYGTTGPGITGFCRVRPSEKIPVLVRLSAQFVNFGDRGAGDLTMMNATYRVSYDTEMWNGTLGVECFGKVSIFKPYIGAGGGIYYVRTITQADRQSGDIGRESDKGTWALGGNLVAGLRAPVRTNLTLDVNVQYDRVSDVEAFTETFEDTHFEFQSISVFVGIYYRLLFPWK